MFPTKKGVIINITFMIISLTIFVEAATRQNALLIIDVQNCFTSGGTLEVANGNDIIPVINLLRQNHEQHFNIVVLSQDWHCSNHVSFASQHSGYSIYSTIKLQYSDGE